MTNPDLNFIQETLDRKEGEHRAVMQERERCLQLVESRRNRLMRVREQYAPDHRNYGHISASIANLNTVLQWISTDVLPTYTKNMNPGGDPP